MAVLIFWAAGVTSTGGLTETVDAKLVADAIPRTAAERCNIIIERRLSNR